MRQFIRAMKHLFASTIFASILFTSIAVAQNVNVNVSGPAGSRNQNLPTGSGSFDVNLPLSKNQVNKVTVSATDENGNVATQDISITQVSFDSLVVAKVTAEPLPIERIEQLVNDGVIDLKDPENFNVSQFTIVLTIAQEPVQFSIPIITPKVEEPTGYEVYQIPQGDGSGGRPKNQPPVQVLVFEVIPPGPPGFEPPRIPGIIVIDGRIKTLKEFYSVKFLMMNTSGIFTLKDVNAILEFPDGGLSNTLPLDGQASLGDILPGDGGTPGQALKEFIIRGDDIGVKGIKVSFGGKVAGPGIPEGEEIPFNGSAQTTVEVKGPPSFLVQVDHPSRVDAGVIYDLTIDITNTGQTPALYTSLDLDMGFDARLVDCRVNSNGDPECVPFEGPVSRSLGHILPGQKVRQVYQVEPLLTGDISSCLGISDQNISLQVGVGNIGCLTGHFPPNRHSPDGSPSVSIVPVNNLIGVGLDSPVLAIFSKAMNESTITTGPGGSFNVYDRAGVRQPGKLRFATLNGDTFVVWQLEDGITNRLSPNMEYTVELLTTIHDTQGKALVSEWTSRFSTTGEAFDDTTPPTITLGVDVPINPSNVFPGQLIKVQAYAADQGSGISRIELRSKDLSASGEKFVLVDKKNYQLGDKFPFVFTIDSKNLVPGHTYQLLGTAYDGMGNAQDATLALVISSTAPNPTVVLPSGPHQVLQGTLFSLTPEQVTGGSYKVDYFINGSATPVQTSTVVPFQLNLSTLTIAPGTFDLRAVAEDGLGQIGETIIQVEVVQNNNGPSIVFASPTPNQQIVVGQPLNVSTSITDPVGVKSIAWRFDNPAGAPFATAVSNFNLTTGNLPLGTHTLYVESINNLNLSSGMISQSFEIINPPPAPPPPTPSITDLTVPQAGKTTVSGTTIANRRVDISNATYGLVTTVYSNGAGAFSTQVEADSGQTIKAKVFDASQQNASAEAVAIVPAPAIVNAIELTPEATLFNAFGLTQNLTVTANLDGGDTQNVTATATYSSSNAAVASVSATGQVVAQANGAATITASYGGKTDTTQITVNVVVPQALEVTPAALNFTAVSQTQQITANLRFSDNSLQTPATGVTYSTGNTTIATVSATGLVTAKGHGVTQVILTRAGVTPVSIPLFVDTGIDQAPTAQILSPAAGTGYERGQTINVSVNASDVDGGVKRIEFSASGAITAAETRQVAPTQLNTTQNFQLVVPNNTVIGGQVTLKAIAVDSGNNSSTFASIIVNIVDTTAPTVSILEPTPTASFDYGDTVSITVRANDEVGVTQLRYVASGSLSFSGTQNFPGAPTTAEHTFSLVVPFGLSDPEATITAYAKDAAGNERQATNVSITVIGADTTPPVTNATAVSNPGSGTTATLSYQVTDGLGDLDYVAIYFRRNSIGTFNRYTNAAGGNPEGKFKPSSGTSGTILFDSTRMGGDGSYEFYTVGVDTAGNNELPPASADVAQSFGSNAAVTVISAPMVITAADTSFDNKNLRVNATTLTIEGSHSFKNIELLNGAVLNHLETDAIEASLNISAWTLSIDSASSINANGRGYLGGLRPGNSDCSGFTVGNIAGSVFRSGGSYGGAGALFAGGIPNPVYGNLTAPNDLGSGGSCGSGNTPGGDGGGKILLQLVNLAADGAITANGLNGSGNLAGSGSGGTINIATATLSGLGPISATGGAGEVSGGGGRIAITYADISTKNKSQITALTSNGSWATGGNGTVFLRSLSEENGSLVIDGQGVSSGFSSLPIPAGYVFDNIVVRNNARVIVSDPIVVNDSFEVLSGSIVTHPAGLTSGLNIAAQRVYVDASSLIDLNGKGYRGGFREGLATCQAETLNGQLGANYRSGGSYGGSGAVYNNETAAALPYGDPLNPTLLGSGGSCGFGNTVGGNGGGFLTINATEEIRIDGTLRADGAFGSGNLSGSGSGGSIHLATSLLRGIGLISANGGVYELGGGGGRIFITYDYLGAIGAEDLNATRNIQAFGGKGSWASGSAGTIVLQRSDQPIGDIYFDEGMGLGTTSGVATALPSIGFGTSASLTSNTLTTDGTTPLLPGSLVGLRINPNINQDQTFEITANTLDTITVDTSVATLTSVADIGDEYSGVFHFGNVFFRRGSYVVLGDKIVVDDKMLIDESGLLTHFGATTTFSSALDMTVENLEVTASGRIDVSGRGYVGGYSGGSLICNGQTFGNLVGSAYRSAGSFGGLGAVFDSGVPNQVYGNLTNPDELGSGGSCGSGNTRGGNGGGKIQLRAGSIVLDGTISANGSNGSGNLAGSGSGGTINIVTSTLDGAGKLNASGFAYELGGGGGRIAVRYDSLGLPQTNIRATGGVGSWVAGGNGTVFLKSSAQGLGDLIVDGYGQNTPTDTTPLPTGVVFDNITFRNNARIIADSGIIANNTIRLENGSSVTHSISSEAGLSINAPTLLVDATSAIDVSTRGYRGGGRNGNPSCNGITLGGLSGAVYRSAGSHGGYGAVYDGNGSNPPYGDPKNPVLLGAGGSCGSGNTIGGNGGGFVEINTTTMVIDGAIRANGQTAGGNLAGSGAGGSIKISTSTFSGSGVIEANGGYYEVGGGGGRVAVSYQTLGAEGNNFENLTKVTALGGKGSWVTGSAGTVLFKTLSQSQGDLFIDEGMSSTALSLRYSPITLIGFGTIASLSADTLVTDGNVTFAPSGLVGLKIKPNIDQNQLFTIVSNTENSITVDTTSANLTDVAQVGDTYVGVHQFDNLTLRRGGYVVVGDQLDISGTININDASQLTHYDVSESFFPRLELKANTLNIATNAAINVDGRGYLGGFQPGNPICEGRTAGNSVGSTYRSGGSYGGLGAIYNGGIPNPVYDNANNPADFGSGGSCGSGNTKGGDGGGWIKINTSTIHLLGTITANGANGSGNLSGSGSGGAINITTNTINGTGNIRANAAAYEVGGGGGRVAVNAVNNGMTAGQFTASAGLGSWASGAAGSVVLP